MAAVLPIQRLTFSSYPRVRFSDIAICASYRSHGAMFISLVSESSSLVASVAFPWTTALVFYLVFFCARANISSSTPFFMGVLARFWIQPDIIMCLVYGLFVHAVTVLVQYTGSVIVGMSAAVSGPRATSSSTDKHGSPLMSTVQYVAIIIAVCLCVSLVVTRYSAADQSQNEFCTPLCLFFYHLLIIITSQNHCCIWSFYPVSTLP